MKTLLLSLIVLVSMMLSHKGLAQIQTLEGITQGTTWHLSYTGEARPQLQSKIEDFLARFDTIYSNYRPDSTISRFNRSPSLEWISVDRELAELVAEALKLSQASQGSFDITAGEISRVWGFAPFSTDKGRTPSEAEIIGARTRSGFQKLEVRLDPPAMKRSVGGLLVDLSGLAQGHAVDQVAALLEKEGLTAFTIEIGGELMAKGRKSEGQRWRIAIESPSDESEGVQEIIELEDSALSTSGTYRSSLEKKGQSFAHIMDPRQGRPVKLMSVSASVIARSCREADALAKAFLMLDTQARTRLARELGLGALVIERDGDKLRTRSFGDFPKAVR